MRPLRTLRGRRAALAASAVCAGAFAAVALGSVPGLQVVGKSSATDSTADKTATVTCPASTGDAVIGGAGRAKGPAGHVALSQVFPTGGGSNVYSVTATALKGGNIVVH